MQASFSSLVCLGPTCHTVVISTITARCLPCKHPSAFPPMDHFLPEAFVSLTTSPGRKHRCHFQTAYKELSAQMNGDRTRSLPLGEEAQDPEYGGILRPKPEAFDTSRALESSPHQRAFSISSERCSPNLRSAPAPARPRDQQCSKAGTEVNRAETVCPPVIVLDQSYLPVEDRISACSYVSQFASSGSSIGRRRRRLFAARNIESPALLHRDWLPRAQRVPKVKSSALQKGLANLRWQTCKDGSSIITRYSGSAKHRRPFQCSRL